MVFETIFGKLFLVVDVAAIDDEGMTHGLFHHAPTGQTELLPLGKQKHGIGI